MRKKRHLPIYEKHFRLITTMHNLCRTNKVSKDLRKRFLIAFETQSQLQEFMPKRIELEFQKIL